MSLVATLRQAEDSIKMGRIFEEYISSIIMKFDEETRRDLSEKDVVVEEIELAGDVDRLDDGELERADEGVLQVVEASSLITLTGGTEDL